ncbi:hypothetical protein DL240_01240 [Lujinxingia litoralis]|uniref:TadE-like domain-containing protein n=1 Tax=Lujinxingia litoralis TaxID=2211119 RepID=A0A328CDR0_9DELT|nr:TadE/TadG family type IV pilus assembly protein [Lujinxingia litoralis]RAL24863.1 hypothetical protein DL240_01240 [Lujinxingia litoralis]
MSESHALPPQHTPDKASRGAATLASHLTSAAGHLVGVCVVFVASWMLLTSAETRDLTVEALRHGLLAQIKFEIWIQLGLSACTWAMGVIAYRGFMASRQRQPRLVKARGTVIVETLIIFPVFLLLLMGLLQLTINNTAGILTTLAAYNAGRTAAIWHPEAEVGRNGVNQGMVRDKARVAAAVAVTPVAPSDFMYSMGSCTNKSTQTLDPKIESMTMGGHVTDVSLHAKAHGNREHLSIANAFDRSSFLSRGQRKLNFAYCATDVSYTTSGTKVTARVEYQHQNAMPMVERIFGDFRTVAGRAAFYSTMVREYTTTLQIPPLDNAPGW